MVSLDRRQALAWGAGAAAFLLTIGARNEAVAASEDVTKAIMDFTGGKEPAAGRVELTTPEIAENGNTVPVSFSVESPMTAGDSVASVLLLAAGNPNPGVATFHFSPSILVRRLHPRGCGLPRRRTSSRWQDEDGSVLHGQEDRQGHHRRLRRLIGGHRRHDNGKVQTTR